MPPQEHNKYLNKTSRTGREVYINFRLILILNEVFTLPLPPPARHTFLILKYFCAEGG